MKRLLIPIALILAFAVPAFADDQPQQVTTTSWFGLSGLYVVPTARTIGKGKVAMSFNESKHVEWVPTNTVTMRFMDRQIRQTLTAGLTDDLEIYASRCKNLLDYATSPRLPNGIYFNYGLKYRVLREQAGRPEVALAVRDISNDMKDISPLKGIYDGRKFYLLASKKFTRKSAPGRFADFTVGIAKDDNATSQLFGAEITLSPTLSFIAEGMSDGPFIDFRNFGKNNQQGRFIYDTGFRLYPDSMPGTVIDAGFIGDGAFEFSFGWSFLKQF